VCFKLNISVIDTRNAIDGSILDRIMEGCSIFGNRTPGETECFFRRKTGIWILWCKRYSSHQLRRAFTSNGKQPFYCAHFSFLTYWTDRDINPADPEQLLLPSLPPFFPLLHFYRLTSYGMQQYCLYGFCLPAGRSGVSVQSDRAYMKKEPSDDSSVWSVMVFRQLPSA